MALIDKLKDTATEAVKVARSAGHEVQRTAAPVVKYTVRRVRSQLDQRRAAPTPERPPPPTPPTRSTRAAVDAPVAQREVAVPPAAPNPAEVAQHIAKKPAPASSRRKPPAKKAAPGAKLPVKRTPPKPDPA